MTKDNLLKTIQENVAFATLAESDDSFLLCLISKKLNIFIPLLRSNGTGFAYIDPDLYDEAQYQGLATFITTLVKEKIFTPIKYTPRYEKAPEYKQEITGFLKPNGLNYSLPMGVKQILSDNGFILSINSGNKSPYKKRDYGTQIEDNPDYKLQYEKDMEDLVSHKADFDKLPRGVKLKYEDIMAGSLDGVLLLGPSGTGKTWITKAIACKAKAHLENIQLSAGTTEDELEGKYAVDDRPDAKATYRFIEGPVLRAYSMGYLLGVQELSNGQPPIISCLNKYLDGTNYVVVNGKTYYRHKNFAAVLTGNSGYRSGTELDESLKNRFSIVQVSKWTTNKYIEVMTNQSERWGHKFPVDFYKKLLEIATVVEQTGKSSGWHEKFTFSIRNAERFLNTILLKPRTFEDFTEALYCDYFNLLSCDNDNLEKLEVYKNDENIIANIKSLYQFYDYSEIEENTKLSDNLDFLFVDDEEDEDGSVTEGVKNKALQSMAKKYKDRFERN